MNKYAIYAGHGGKDAGAVNGSMYEKNYTLAVANRLSELLRAVGHAVIQNRSNDVDRSITADANKANAEKVDAVIELHLNSNAGTPATGTETFHSIHGGKGQMLAQEIQEKIVDEFGYANRGIKTKVNKAGKDYLGIIRQTSAPCVLVEMCFINNNADMAKWDTDRMSRAIRDGINAAMGGTSSASTGISSEGTSTQTNTNAATSEAELRKQGIMSFQRWLNAYGNYGLSVDGKYGPKTKAAWIKALQTWLNRAYNAGLAVDGKFGPRTKAACVTLSRSDTGDGVYILQGALYCRGYIYSGFDGKFGSMTESEVKSYQGANGLVKDGLAGRNTFASLAG